MCLCNELRAHRVVMPLFRWATLYQYFVSLDLICCVRRLDILNKYMNTILFAFRTSSEFRPNMRPLRCIMQRFLSLQNDRHPWKYVSHNMLSDFEVEFLICCSDQSCGVGPSILGVLFYLHTHIYLYGPPLINT